MKSSIALLALSAALATAGPVDKRAAATHLAVVVETKYVYPDGQPAPTPSRQPGAFYLNDAPEPTSTEAPVSSAAPEALPAPPPPPPPAEIVPELPVEVPQVPAPAPQPDYQPPAAPADGSFPSAALFAHNSNRARHGVPDMVWDDALASYAAQSASNCVFDHDLSPGGGGYGQNIAMYGNSGGLPSPEEAISMAASDQWYKSELPLYPGFGFEPPMDGFEKWGHMTQVVWRNSVKLGCAVHRCGGGTLAGYATYYTVCNYSPPGNFGGQYAQNVPAPL